MIMFVIVKKLKIEFNFKNEHTYNLAIFLEKQLLLIVTE